MSERDMNDLLALVERHLGASWLEIVEWLREHNSLDEVARRLEAHDLDGAIQEVEAAGERFAADIHAGYVEAGQQAAAWLQGASGDIVRFDAANHRAVAWAQRNQLELVRGLTTEQREVARRVITDGVAAGRNPREVARDLRDSIGLTDYQAQVVANYRSALEAGDWSDALGRQLTDGRDDRSVAAARRADRALKPEQIDTMVERYRQNMVTFRAETIARTEGLRAAHQGTEELFRQAVDRGDVEADSLVREWNHASAGRFPRRDHEAMDGQERKLGEPFQSGSGALLRFPGDPQADPSETVNCRCVISTRLVG